MRIRRTKVITDSQRVDNLDRLARQPRGPLQRPRPQPRIRAASERIWQSPRSMAAVAPQMKYCCHGTE